MKKNIGCDLDDCIWDLISPLVSNYNENYSQELRIDQIQQWNISQYLYDKDEKKFFAPMYEPKFWDFVFPFADAYQYLMILNKYTNLYIVTATFFEVAGIKMKRFCDLFPFVKREQIIITHDKQRVDVDLLIDDKFENLEGGRYGKILFDRPHNQLQNEKSIGALRAKNWVDVMKGVNILLPGWRE